VSYGLTRIPCRRGNGAHVRCEGSPIRIMLPPPLLHGSYETVNVKSYLLVI